MKVSDMNKPRLSRRPAGALAAGLLAFALAGCGGGGGGNEFPPPTLPTTIDTGQAALAAAGTLAIRIDSASVAGKPEIEFTVTNQAGAGMTGLRPADLKFNIAKLMPVPSGDASRWQNYINVANGGVVQASQERLATGAPFGTLTGLGSGRYRYQFATDITSPQANPCPAPCTGADARPLELRFDAGLTHRVTVEQANPAFPRAAGTLDFAPDGSPVVQREVVATATCNTCHAQITAHETRVDTKLCVTCHNPGSSSPGAPAASLDLRSMVHRIHFNNAGAALPSVRAGVPNRIGTKDYSAVTFTQDVRNCTRCHDGSANTPHTTPTPQGDRWKTNPTQAACASCHDDVFFGSAPDPTRPWQTKAHSGGPVADDSTCALCHGAGKFADAKDIVVAHSFPARIDAAAARFRFDILSVTATAPGSRPVVTFTVTDPANADAAYDIKTHPAFVAPGGASTLSVKIGWPDFAAGQPAFDFANDGSGQSFGQPVTINALTAAATPGPTAGTFVVTSPVAVPALARGTLRVTLEGHPAGDVTTPGTFSDRLLVKTALRDAAITGTVTPRRVVVDIAKCNVCHDTLSLHGNNRTSEIGACDVCHNPNATDKGRRPAGLGVDGKAEESIDLKRLVHGIHAGEASQGGFRTQGLVVYGFGGSVNDFGHVKFPGRLSDCATCHVGTSYRLDGAWATPTASGILGSTVDSAAAPADSADNLRISPTAAVCSSCHDSPVARLHMQDATTGGTFSATQASLRATAGENCTFCHGAGDALDVKTVHGVD